MGNPTHYSLELPERCLQLIDGLWPHVQKLRERDRPHEGPLTSTFLLSMAIPIIALPIERLERHVGKKSEGYADDRFLDPRLAKTVSEVLGARRFADAPFFEPAAWSYVKWKSQGENIGRGIPRKLADSLESREAFQAAAQMQSSQWASALRNALAHGGVAYLDDAGRSADHAPVAMFCFVSGKFAEDGRTLTHMNCLRIRESAFLSFLRSWVNWLRETGASALLAA